MAKQAQPITQKTFRLPIIGTFQNRIGTTGKDQRFLNCFAESRKNDITETKKTYLIKRPGLSLVDTLSAGTARGITYFDGHRYVAIGSTLYKDSTSFLTLNGTSGHVGFIECTTETENALFVADGTDCYLISKAGTYVTIPTAHSAWVTLTVYADGAYAIPTVANGYYYEVVIAGTSGGTQPVWPTYIGGQITDGTVTWKCSGYYGFSWGARQNSTAYTLGAEVVPAVSNGYYYGCSVAGTTAGTEPSMPQTIGATVVDGGVTWTCAGRTTTASPMPKNHLPYPVYMDGYVFLTAKRSDGSNGTFLYNSDIDNPLSWNQTYYISAEQYPDNLQCLARQNNMVVAIGEYSTEFFHDAGNATGSPVSRNDSITLQFGTISPETVMQNERFMIWVGQSDLGGKAVWLIDGFQPKKVSDEYIERIIDAEGAAISSARAYGVRTNGHFFYVLSLSGRTLVYDLEEKMWHEWSTNSSGTHIGFLGTYACDSHTGKAFILGNTDGKIYYLDPTIYQDNSIDILMDIYTTKYDFESMSRKFMSSFNLVGDEISGGTIALRWSDDDYTTWSGSKVLPLSPRTFFTRLGAFRRRSFNITYTGNSHYRIEGIEFEVALGTH